MARSQRHEAERPTFSDTSNQSSTVIETAQAALMDLNRTQAQFLLTETQIGLTLLDVALNRRDAVGARLSLSRAREALDMVNAHLDQLSTEPDLYDAVEKARDLLEIRLYDAQRALTRTAAPVGRGQP